jgi:hypothetical protein
MTEQELLVDFWLPQRTPFDQAMLNRRVSVTLFGETAWVTTAEDCILHGSFDFFQAWT